MKIAKSTVSKLTISDVYGLDPVHLFLEDIAPGKGSITMKCFNRSWTAYWGSMGRSVADFFCSCDEHYLASSFGCVSATVFDFDALMDAAKKDIIKSRCSLAIDRGEARALFDELHEKLGLGDTLDDVHQLDPVFMSKIFGDEWWRSLPEKTNPEYAYVCRIINAAKEGVAESSRLDSLELASR